MAEKSHCPACGYRLDAVWEMPGVEFGCPECTSRLRWDTWIIHPFPLGLQPEDDRHKPMQLQRELLGRIEGLERKLDAVRGK